MTRLLALDTETTSADPNEARLVTVYLGILNADGVVELEQEWLVRPDGYDIPAEASAIHGISHEHAAQHGRPLRDVLQQVWAVITMECGEGRLPLCAMNARYDCTVLTREFERTFGGTSHIFKSVDILDPYVLDKHLDRFRKGRRRLIDLAAHYGVSLPEEEAHGARADGIAAGRVAQRLLQDYRLRGMQMDEITEAEVVWAAEQANSLRAWFLISGKTAEAAAVTNEWPVAGR